MKASLIGLAFMLGIGFAAEPVSFPIEVGSLKTRLKTYEGAKIVDADAIGVKVVHESGSARVPFHMLPPELASKFEVDKTAAREQAAQEVASESAYHQQIAAAELVALREKLEEEKQNGGRPKKSQADLMIESIRAQRLQDYIFSLRSGIVKTEAEIQKRMLRARQAQMRANARAVRSGNFSTYYRGGSRAISMRIRALPYQEKIEQAKLLIERSEMEIMRLERGSD